MDEYPLRHHFLNLCLPFFHRFTQTASEARSKAMKGALKRWDWWGVNVASGDNDTARALATAMDEALFFLPQAREVLFPEFIGLGADLDAAKRLLAEVREYTSRGQLAQWLVRHETVHLALRQEYLEPLRKAWICRAAEGKAVPVALVGVEALLLPDRVGLLVLRFAIDGKSQALDSQPASAIGAVEPSGRPTLADLSFAAYCLRILYPLKLGWDMPKLIFPQAACGNDERARRCGGCSMEVRHLVDFLLQDLAEEPGSSSYRPVAAQTVELDVFCRPFAAPNNRSAEDSAGFRYTETEEAKLFAPLVPVYAYACINDAAAVSEEAETGAGHSRAERLLFEVSQGLEPGQSLSDPLWRPDADRIKELLDKGGLRLWEIWQGLVTEASAWYLAFQAHWACVVTQADGDKEPQEGFVAHNIATDYFCLFLYCLYQRTVLQLMAEDSLIDWRQPPAALLRRTRELVQRFTTFRSRGWFADVTSREQGEVIYDTYRRALGLNELYDAVAAAVEDISRYNESRYERQVSWLLGILTVVGLPLATVLGYYEILGTHEWTFDRWLGFAVAMLSGVLLGAAVWLWATNKE